MKLYLVDLRGMASSYGKSYVIANDPTEAYHIVKKFLDDENLGFTHERELESIKLLADTERYPKCETRLYLSENILLNIMNKDK